MIGMGVSSNGTINPPKGKVIWFQGFGRVRPGAVGTAVIAGHVAKGDEPDTFSRLSRVDVGDTIQIVDGGKTKTYRVNRASAIDKTKVTTDKAVWGTNTSHSRLAIITCDDALGYRSDGHRVANFVLIADRIYADAGSRHLELDRPLEEATEPFRRPLHGRDVGVRQRGIGHHHHLHR